MIIPLSSKLYSAVSCICSNNTINSSTELPLRRPKRHDQSLPPTQQSTRLPLRTPKKAQPSIELPRRTPNRHDQSPKKTQPIKPLTINTTKSKRKKSSTSNVIRLMDSLNQPITTEIYSSLIKECILRSDSRGALLLHSRLVNQSSLKMTLYLFHLLLFMHLSFGHFDIARHLFDKMPHRKDFLSWAIIVIGYLDNSYYEEAIVLFIEMISQNNICDIISEFPSCVAVIVCIFKACVYSLNMGIGTQIHGFLLKLGVTDDYSVNVSLMNFYGKFGFLESSNSIFNQLCHRSTVIWTAKIVNNCREGYFNEVIKDFMEMGRSGVRRNSFTFSSVLKACARMNDDGHCGKQVHAIAIKLGVESNDFVQCGLIDMYSKCGIVRDAKRVFDVITDKAKTAHWNALLMGYVRNGLYIEAFKFLYHMKAVGIEVNKSLVDRVRIACATDTLENRTELEVT